MRRRVSGTLQLAFGQSDVTQIDRQCHDAEQQDKRRSGNNKNCAPPRASPTWNLSGHVKFSSYRIHLPIAICVLGDECS
jgi:hypothetical protein